MSELKYDHDPHFPYLVVNTSGEPCAKYNYRQGAEWLLESWQGYGRIIDTTPKPKIPEDARFLHWFSNGGNYVAVWENFNPLKPWELESVYYSEEELIAEIGEAEVTVLVRKEES